MRIHSNSILLLKMNKKKLFIFWILFVFLLIGLVEAIEDKPTYHDGNFSNGEFLNFKDWPDKWIFVQGEASILEKNSSTHPVYAYASIKMDVKKDFVFKDNFFDTEVVIKRGGLFTWEYELIDGKQEREAIHFYEENGESSKTISIYLDNKLKTRVNINTGVKIETIKGTILEFNSLSFDSMFVNLENENSIKRLILTQKFTDNIPLGIIKIENETELVREGPNFLSCPTLTFNGPKGEIKIRNNEFLLNYPGELIMNNPLYSRFVPSKEISFQFATIDDVPGCLNKIYIKSPTKGSDNLNYAVYGTIFTFDNGIKIIDGGVKLRNIEIVGKNIYFYKFRSDFEKVDTNEKIKKGNFLVYFSEETKSLVVSNNFNGTLIINGQKTIFENGKPKKINPDHLNFYEIMGQQETEFCDWGSSSNALAQKSKEDTTCEKMGGRLEINNPSCNIAYGNTIYALGMIGEETNRFTGVKITDYQKGKTCCVAAKFEKGVEAVCQIGDKSECIRIDKNTVGRNVFKSPKGTIVIDLAQHFLDSEVKIVESEALTNSAQSNVPTIIRPTDLKVTEPEFVGVYYGVPGGSVEITRPIIGSKLSKPTIVHELLHHFYNQGNTEIIFQQIMRTYLQDGSLTEKQNESRENLINRLKDWESHYNLHDPLSGDYFRRITCNEGHSVIGEWIYSSFIGESGYRGKQKFPDYILKLYEGILKPEIINEGR